jgi:hypothetical protein
MPGVVVELTDGCEEYEGGDCVLGVTGPFRNKEAAREAFTAAKAAGNRPHWVSLTSPLDWDAYHAGRAQPVVDHGDVST